MASAGGLHFRKFGGGHFAFRRPGVAATEHTIRQDLMEMAARLQAIADEIDEP